MTVLLLVLSQILVSNFMEIDDAGKISQDSIEFYGTWLHIITGLLIIPVALIFIVVEVKGRGP